MKGIRGMISYKLELEYKWLGCKLFFSLKKRYEGG